jgi:hypothetical protein
MARGEDFASRRLAEQPFEGLVTTAPKVCGEADPVIVHIRAERSSGRVHRYAACLPGYLRELEAQSTQLRRHRHLQIVSFPQIVEVFLKELVVAVVARRP